MARKEDECILSSTLSGGQVMVSLGILLLVALAGFLVSASLRPAQNSGTFTLNQAQEHSITVNGEAQQTVTPDQLVIQLSVETQEDTATLSQSKNAEIMDKVKKALLSKGILDKDITTSSYSVYPVEQSHWICPDYKPDCSDDEKIYDTKITGYKTVHYLTVKTSDINNGGAVVDAAVNAGANVNSIYFTLKDETRRTIEQNLLKYASANAKDKAQKIADGLNVKLGQPISASNSYVYFPGPVYKNYYAMAAENYASTNLSPGEQVVTASVTVSYKIE